MAYKRKRRTVTLEFTDEQGEFAGLEVEAASLPLGEFFKLSKAVSKGDVTEREMEMLLGTFARSLVSWNVVEEDGTPVPANYDGIMTMDLDFVLKLVDTWLRAVSPPDPGSDLGKGSPSGKPFPGRPVTMEAL